MNRQGWLLVVVAAVGLGLVSLASNVMSVSQLHGQADAVLAVRFTFSKVVNAPALWAGVLVLAGWLVRRRAPAVAAGVAAGVLALAVHYGVGAAVGMFDAAGVADNWYWFVAALVVGGPLGFVGAIARRVDWWGTVARLAVPVALVLEPFQVGMFTSPAILPWPDRVSSIVSGMVLVGAGAVGVLAVLVAAMKERGARRADREGASCRLQ